MLQNKPFVEDAYLFLNVALKRLQYSACYFDLFHNGKAILHTKISLFFIPYHSLYSISLNVAINIHLTKKSH